VTPTWEAFNGVLEYVYTNVVPVIPFAKIAPHDRIPEKVAFVDAHKPAFRSALQKWGQLTKDLSGDNLYWVDQTISRSLTVAPCLNGDTRFDFEMAALRNCNWRGVYVGIDRETQDLRRPGLTDEQRTHISETSIQPSDCDLTVDGRAPVAEILLTIAEYLHERGF
jgi:hypothetical protein